MGDDEGPDVDYGSAPDDTTAFLKRLRTQIIAAGQRKLARESGVSRRTIERLIEGDKCDLHIIAKIRLAVGGLKI